MISYRHIYDQLTEIMENTKDESTTLELSLLRIRIAKVLDVLERKTPEWSSKNYIPTICVDFDGVLSEYRDGWKGHAVITDKPMPGAFEWLDEAVNVCRIMIFSARCNHPDGIAAMYDWMKFHGMKEDTLRKLIFEPGKPSWYIHIDDRNIKFDGDWKALPSAAGFLKYFKPWYYHKQGWRDAQD